MWTAPNRWLSVEISLNQVQTNFPKFLPFGDDPIPKMWIWGSFYVKLSDYQLHSRKSHSVQTKKGLSDQYFLSIPICLIPYRFLLADFLDLVGSTYFQTSYMYFSFHLNRHSVWLKYFTPKQVCKAWRCGSYLQIWNYESLTDLLTDRGNCDLNLLTFFLIMNGKLLVETSKEMSIHQILVLLVSSPSSLCVFEILKTVMKINVSLV